MSSKIDGACKTCNGTGIEYDGAGHTCTSCNGIAAPVVERQPNRCGQCSAPTTDICNQNGCGFLESGNGAPPELAELQATIAQQAAEIERLKSVTNFKDAVACVFDYLKTAAANTDSKEWDDQLEELAEDVIEYAPEYKKEWKDIGELCAEIERLKGGQGEPRIYEVRIQDEAGDPDESPFFMDFVNKAGADNYKAHHDRVTVTPLYASQPTPVSVVLPEFNEWYVEANLKMTRNQIQMGSMIWNACLDKVKELNQ